ncbi:MAG TPA: hypothetical protein VFC63_27585 [Blastocatellia bacterium]|nr:hypothetical protein [Blastocatellia bacterium]
MESIAGGNGPARTGKVINWKKEWPVCILLSVAFGIFVCTASNKALNRQDHRSESVEMEHNILRGQPFHHGAKLIYVPAWQNRILFPALLELGTRLGVLTPSGWYLLIRLLISIAMFTSFWLVLRSDAQAEIKLASAGLLLLAYNLVITFMSATEMTSDFPEAIFAAFFIAASLRRKRVVLLVLSVIAAANRESAAFAGVIWFFLYAIDERRKINWRETGYAALVSICSYGTAIAIRYAFGGAQAVKSKTQILMLKGNYDSVKDFLSHPTPFSWVGLIFCFLVPDLLWIAANRKSLTLHINV